ncbi:MAG: 50S ribosome-binding GTPase [Tagaea sp.]|nr:50S ribosome-binding GTPase [Tagaea sp.]
MTLLRAFWRETILVALLVLPWLVLLPLGVLWLWEHGAALWWLLGSAVLGIAAFGLRRAILRASKPRSVAAPVGTPNDDAAWALVEAKVRATEPFDFAEPKQAGAALERLVTDLAHHYNGDSPEAVYDVTLPELLLLAERTAKTARAAALANVPGVRALKFGHLLWLNRQIATHGASLGQVFEKAEWAWRLFRLVKDPASGAMGEIGRYLLGGSYGVLSARIRASLTALLLRETGRAAIELYSGRLRLTAEEVAAADGTDRVALDEVGPVRIALMGQINAGKSSLFNALAGQVHREIGIDVSAQKPGEIAIARDGKPEIVLREAAGLSGGKAPSLDEARGADLVVWVASATQPARNIDMEALRDIRAAFAADPARKAPPFVLALTHIDALSPKLEWAPPYDLRDAARPKAKNIRAAVDHVCAELGFAPGDCVPIAARAPGDVYGADALWASIADRLGPARAAKLARVLASRSGWDAGEILAQAWNAGKVLARGAIAPGRPPTP